MSKVHYVLFFECDKSVTISEKNKCIQLGSNMVKVGYGKQSFYGEVLFEGSLVEANNYIKDNRLTYSCMSDSDTEKENSSNLFNYNSNLINHK
jgi:hypothetical protein